MNFFTTFIVLFISGLFVNCLAEIIPCEGNLLIESEVIIDNEEMNFVIDDNCKENAFIKLTILNADNNQAPVNLTIFDEITEYANFQNERTSGLFKPGPQLIEIATNDNYVNLTGYKGHIEYQYEPKNYSTTLLPFTLSTMPTLPTIPFNISRDLIWNLTFQFDPIPRKISECDTFSDLEPSELNFLNLQPNSFKCAQFNGTRREHFFEFSGDLSSPTFSIISMSSGLENGKKGVLTIQPLSESSIPLAITSVNTSTVTHINVFTQNSFQYSLSDRVHINYDIGENISTTTQMSTSTTTTLDPNMEIVDVYIIGVNQKDFVEEFGDDLKNEIRSLASDSGICRFYFSNYKDCNLICSMTENENRACVYIEVSVIDSVLCDYDNSLLREDINEYSDEWAKNYGARSIRIDNCLDEEKSWIVMAILLPIVGLIIVIVVIVIIIIQKKAVQKINEKKRIQQRKEVQIETKQYRSAEGRGRGHLEEEPSPNTFEDFSIDNSYY